jgi:NAD-dependent deacetylase sirtuin 1
MFDIHYFNDDPRPFFRFCKEIYPGQFTPSPSHYFIAALEQRGKLLRHYTQNIDTLEHTAGISRVVYCHGGAAVSQMYAGGGKRRAAGRRGKCWGNET